MLPESLVTGFLKKLRALSKRTTFTANAGRRPQGSEYGGGLGGVTAGSAATSGGGGWVYRRGFECCRRCFDWCRRGRGNRLRCDHWGCGHRYGSACFGGCRWRRLSHCLTADEQAKSQNEGRTENIEMRRVGCHRVSVLWVAVIRFTVVSQTDT